jgi:ribosome-associated heat shock protein Hsp15
MPRQQTSTGEPAASTEPQTVVGADNGQRLDKWLWYARVVKSRTLAAALVQDGKVRINRERIAKPSQTVRPGDVITVAVHRRVRVLRVVSGGARRGPAKEAVSLYEDLSPQSGVGRDGPASQPGPGITFETGAGRPTKRDRRAIDKLKEA